jgi:aryl-alcohol dehydrogenase-like predicted oxidoreductase
MIGNESQAVASAAYLSFSLRPIRTPSSLCYCRMTTVIPGARTTAQAKANAAAAELPPLGAGFLAGVRELYDRELRAQIHDRW